MILVVVSCDLLLRRFDPRLRNRLRDLESKQPDSSARHGMLKRVMLRPGSASRLTANLMPNDEQLRMKIQTRLLRAGIHDSGAVAHFFGARLLAILAPPAVGVVLWYLGFARLNYALLWSALFSGIGMILPSLWLDSRIALRQNILRRSLSDFLDLFVACVESGMTLQGMIGTVSAELRTTHPELATEFAICHQQVQLGYSLEAAAADLAERTGVDDLQSFSTFVRQSLSYGAEIGEALRDLSDTLRMQREMRAEELAQKAAVKILIPTLFFIFPAVFVVAVGPAAIRIQESMSKTNPAAAREAK